MGSKFPILTFQLLSVNPHPIYLSSFKFAVIEIIYYKFQLSSNSLDF